MFLNKNVYNVNFKLPMWAIMMLISIPILAYVDVQLFAEATFKDYLMICGTELFLIFLGFIIGINAPKKEEKPEIT